MPLRVHRGYIVCCPDALVAWASHSLCCWDSCLLMTQSWLPPQELPWIKELPCGPSAACIRWLLWWGYKGPALFSQFRKSHHSSRILQGICWGLCCQCITVQIFSHLRRMDADSSFPSLPNRYSLELSPINILHANLHLRTYAQNSVYRLFWRSSKNQITKSSNT